MTLFLNKRKIFTQSTLRNKKRLGERMLKLNLAKASVLLVMLSVVCMPLYAADGGSPNIVANFLPMVLIIAIFYLFLIRPSQKKAKEHQNMLNSIQRNDKIITSGGIYGTISQVKADRFEVTIAEGIKIEISKGSVSTVIVEPQVEPSNEIK